MTTLASTRRMMLMVRFAVAGVVAAGWMYYAWTVRQNPSTLVSDFDQLWFASRAMLDGRNPYEVIGPGMEFDYPWRFYYPLSAAVVTVPLAVLPLDVARLAWVGLSTFVLAYLVLGEGVRRIPMLLSRSLAINSYFAQWNAWLTAAIYAPVLAFFWSSKPNLGLAFSTSLTSVRSLRIAAVAAIVPVAIAFLVQPGWVADWLAALRTSDHFQSLVRSPGGVILLLAAFRWRYPEARLFLALALVPHTPSVMGALPLFLIPRSVVGTTILALLSYANAVLLPSVIEPGMTFADTQHAQGTLLVWTMYLPTLAMILIRPARPQESDFHAGGPWRRRTTP